MPCHNQPRHAPGSLTAVSPMAKPVFLSPESCLWWDTTQSEHSPLPRCPGSAPLDQAVAAQWGPAGGFLSPLWSSQFGPESRKPMLSSPIFRPSWTPKPPTGRQASSGRALKARWPPAALGPHGRVWEPPADFLPLALSAVKLPTEIEGLMEKEDLWVSVPQPWEIYIKDEPKILCLSPFVSKEKQL